MSRFCKGGQNIVRSSITTKSIPPLILDNKYNSKCDTGELDILPQAVETSIQWLKSGKSPAFANVPSELLKHSWPELVSIFTLICQKIWSSKQGLNLDSTPDITTSEEGKPLSLPELQACQNY